MGHSGIVGILFPLVALGGPLLLGLAWLVWGRSSAAGAVSVPARWDWRLVLRSSLLYALAFNIIFFIQELFLVLPKALTPGLRPTLFHNNHSWEGEHPLAALFQGTGALAIFLTGLVCAVLLRRRAAAPATGGLFLVWLAYNGLFQSLPQVVIGALAPGSDVGMAMDYFGMSANAKTVAALLALAAIVLAGIWLTRPMLALADSADRIGDAGARFRFMLNIATVPALLAIPLIILFRVPRELAEVVVPPIAVTIVGIAWLQANAWRAAGVRPSGLSPLSLRTPLAAVAVLLLIFQLVLRPGIPFF